MTTKKKSGGYDLAKVEDLLPANVDFDDMLENLAEMDNIEYPRIRFKKIGKRPWLFYLTDDDDDQGVEEFEGVILFYGRQNTYWAQGYDKDNPTPPDCFSVDGKTGSKSREGNKFGDCRSCHFNKFKSHPTGKGKACRNQIKVYIQRVGNIVPSTLFLAPTSLGSFTRNYLMDQITQKGLSYWKVLTKFKVWQKDDENYARIKFEVGAVYKGEEVEPLKNMRGFWLETIQADRQTLDAEVTTPSDSDNSSNDDNSTNREVQPTGSVVTTPPADDMDDDVPF